jgi:hypothetical protein
MGLVIYIALGLASIAYAFIKGKKKGRFFVSDFLSLVTFVRHFIPL